MQDWSDKLDEFLRFNDRAVLTGAGGISKKQADAKAGVEFEKFESVRRLAKEHRAEVDYFDQLSDLSKQDKK